MANRRWLAYRNGFLFCLSLAWSGCGGDTPAPKATAPLPAAVDSLARQNPAISVDSSSVGETMPMVTKATAAVDSAARLPLELTLRQIGYQNGLSLLGARDAITLAIPVNEGLHPSHLHLRVLPTPGMPNAVLMLRQRDRILAMRPVSDSTTTLDFPLDEVVVEAGKASITFALNIPGQDVCQAALSYHTVLLPESQVTFDGTPTFSGEVNGFFQPWVSQVTFYVAESPSLDAAQAALDAAAFTARHYRGMSTTFKIRPLPTAGESLAEPGPWERAIVWSPEGDSRVILPEGGRGTVLAIAARRDARQLFTLVDGDGMVASNSFRTGEVNLASQVPDATRPVRTLAELGYSARTIEGSSLVMSSYTFSMADLGAASTPTAFRLVAEQSGIPANGNGTLRVQLNGSLIYSRPLDRRSIDQVVSLPAHLLLRDNVLDVRFQVVLGEGGCTMGGALFTATIDPQSAFIIDAGEPIAPGFGRFPSALLPAFSVLLEPRDRYRVELAATVIGAMQATTRTPLAPAIARDRVDAKGPLLAIGGSGLADYLEAPVHSDAFRLRDRDGQLWDEFTPATPYAAMQGWQARDRNILLLHHTQANGQPLADLLQESLASYGWFGVRGDLALRGTVGRTRVLAAASAGWQLENAATSSRSVVERYRSAVFLFAALVLFGLLIWLYPRVVRRELDPTG